MSVAAAAPSVGTLYDVPVSNNGGRCRMVLYYKSVLPTEVAIVSPAALGGLKSEAYLQANPQGKMPLLSLSEANFPIPESDTICRFLCARFADRGPALIPTDLMLAARSDRICRLHDIYLGAVQSAMYKVAGSGGSQAFPPFGPFGDREAALGELMSQLKVLEDYADAEGPFLVGKEPTLADCTIWPSAIFWAHMLPKFASVDPAAIFGPRLSRWMKHMATTEVGGRVQREVADALVEWDAKDRWAPIRGAGVRDTAAPTIFDSILAKANAQTARARFLPRSRSPAASSEPPRSSQLAHLHLASPAHPTPSSSLRLSTPYPHLENSR